MHTTTRPHARATAVAALLAAGIVLVGCTPTPPNAPSASDGEPTPSATSAAPSPTASATPSATATATPTATEAEERLFETQNGTMRLRLPEGWTVSDQSRLSTDGRSGQVWWENMIGFTSPGGLELDYYDGFGGNAGFIRTDFAIVEELPSEIASDVAAMSWWVHDFDRYFVYAGMATHSGEGTEPIPEFVLPGVERNHHFTVVLSDESDPAVATQAEAEELLGGADIAEALELIAAVQLTGVDPSALPPGVEP